MKIPTNVMAILRSATTDGPHLHLTGPRMDPRLYRRVNEVIEGAGGRWDAKVQAHVFPAAAADALAPVVESGHVTTLREARQASQYFPTPTAVVDRLVELAEVKPGMEVLEPSAGRGAIASVLVAHGVVVDCIERDPDHAAVLKGSGAARNVQIADFLAVPTEPRYDRVVMNPPFTSGADIQHVTHALRFLKPGGLLVAVMSNNVTFGRGEAVKFRAMVEQHGGTLEYCADKAFAESGTAVKAVIVTIPADVSTKPVPVQWSAPIEVESGPDMEYRPPLEILAEIQADMRQALVEMDELAKLLAEPINPRPDAEVVELPVRLQQDQLPFEDLGGAA